jgi:DHA1 family bicyclomycin/chloramphenicol resistance-like MFS transporter
MRAANPLASPAPALRIPERRPPVLALIAISALSPFAINSVVPSIPAIGAAFGAEYGRVQLVLSAFLASIAISQIFIGPISDRFGRRPVLLVGFFVFVLASVASPFAPSVEALIAIRVLQGASGCVGIVLGRAIIRDLYDRRQAASMLGYVTMGLAMAPMVAPTVGGLLQELSGWTAIFWLMAALGVACLLVAWFLIPETNLAPAASLNFRTILSDFGTLVRRRDFLLFTANSSLTTGVFFSFLGGAPYVAERILELRPSVYGLWFAILPIGYACGSFLAGRFTERFGVPTMIMAGSALQFLAVLVLLVLNLAGFSGAGALFVPMAVSGLANGIALPSAISGAISVRPEIAGAASGLSGAVQLATGALLSVLASALLTGDSALPMLAVMIAAAALALLAAAAIALRDRR